MRFSLFLLGCTLTLAAQAAPDLPAAVHPEGWHNWQKPDSERTAFYAEFASTGPGAPASPSAP